jgi:hypothetical protein
MVILAAWALVAAHPGFVFKAGQRTPAMIMAEPGVGVGEAKRQ